MERIDRKFKELMGYRLNNTSLIHQFDILEDDEGNFLLNIWKNYLVSEDVKNNEDFISYYDVPENSWFDQISYEAYENENLWWIVAMANDVVNPFEELTPGETIKILDDSLLYQIIKEIKNISEL